MTTEEKFKELAQTDDFKRTVEIMERHNKGLTERERSLKQYIGILALSKLINDDEIPNEDLENEKINILLRIITYLEPPITVLLKNLKRIK